jgi:hypothetical protein
MELSGCNGIKTPVTPPGPIPGPSYLTTTPPQALYTVYIYIITPTNVHIISINYIIIEIVILCEFM